MFAPPLPMISLPRSRVSTGGRKFFASILRIWAKTGPTLVSKPEHVAPDVAQILRIEAKNFRPPVETRERGSEIIGRGGANMAQILGDDQIRGQCFQHLGIDGVQTFPAVNALANEGVDFRGGSTARHARMND